MSDKVLTLPTKIGTLLEIVQQIAAGNFSVRAPVSSTMDDFDALSTGINMLAEELAIRDKKIQEQIDELIRWNKLFTDRELKMVDLKKEIDQLKREVAELKKYIIPTKISR